MTFTPDAFKRPEDLDAVLGWIPMRDRDRITDALGERFALAELQAVTLQDLAEACRRAGTRR